MATAFSAITSYISLSLRKTMYDNSILEEQEEEN